METVKAGSVPIVVRRAVSVETIAGYEMTITAVFANDPEQFAAPFLDLPSVETTRLTVINDDSTGQVDIVVFCVV